MAAWVRACTRTRSPNRLTNTAIMRLSHASFHTYPLLRQPASAATIPSPSRLSISLLRTMLLAGPQVRSCDLSPLTSYFAFSRLLVEVRELRRHARRLERLLGLLRLHLLGDVGLEGDCVGGVAVPLGLQRHLLLLQLPREERRRPHIRCLDLGPLLGFLPILLVLEALFEVGASAQRVCANTRCIALMGSRSRSYCPFRFASALSSCAFHAALNFWSSAHRSVLLALLLLLALGAHGDVGGGGDLVVLFVGPRTLVAFRSLSAAISRSRCAVSSSSSSCSEWMLHSARPSLGTGSVPSELSVPRLGIGESRASG